MSDKKTFLLMNKNVVVLSFCIIQDIFSENYIVESIENKFLIPRNLRDLQFWISERYILNARYSVGGLLELSGISDIDIGDFIEETNCISLKDTYWVSPLYDRYLNALEDGAMFDCRAFNVPREEVTNNIYWRQLDASRNSIQMLGQVHFAHKELQNKSCNEIQDMLMTRKGINWNNLPAYQKRGSCCVKRKYFEEQEEDGKLVKVERSHWEVDVNIPIFKGDGREYIEQLLEPEE